MKDRTTRRVPAGTPSDHERFWRKVDRDGSCWMWTATTSHGYGVFSMEIAPRVHRNFMAHRVAYEWAMNQPIPEGLVLDHLCRTPLCVNPDHLEPVTDRENVLRGNGASARNASKTACPVGHDYETHGSRLRRGDRYCLTCARERNRRRYRQAAS